MPVHTDGFQITAFDVKPVVAVFVHRVLRSREYKSGVMAEPADIQHDGVIGIDDGSHQKTVAEAVRECGVAVDVAEYQTQNHGEQQAQGDRFHYKNHDLFFSHLEPFFTTWKSQQSPPVASVWVR